MAGLSKSKAMSSLQCLKRMHLEVHRKDLVQFSASTQAAFKLGHRVDNIAVELYSQGSTEDHRFLANLNAEQWVSSNSETPTSQVGGILSERSYILP